MSISIAGQVVLVDEVDADLLAQRSWHLNSGYARGKIRGRRVYLHRLIAERMGLSGELIDHVNRVKTDCRRCNLRVADGTQNLANQAGRPTVRASAFKGVTPGKLSNGWRAQIGWHGKRLTLGTFSDEAAAARAYDAAALFLFGEFAATNFADSQPMSPAAILEAAAKARKPWGCSGVSYSERFKKFRAYTRTGKHLGWFKTPGEAVAVARAAW